MEEMVAPQPFPKSLRRKRVKTSHNVSVVWALCLWLVHWWGASLPRQWLCQSRVGVRARDPRALNLQNASDLIRGCMQRQAGGQSWVPQTSV